MKTWLDWNGITHIVVQASAPYPYTVCWISITADHDDAPRISTCLACVAWSPRAHWYMEKS